MTSTQGYNRYSYVHNNPLNAIDPSGHFSLRKYVGLIVAVIGGIFCPPCLAFGWQAFALGAFAGAAGAIANGADILAGALLGGVSGLAFAGVNGVEFGTGFGAELAQFASFGAVGGVTAVLAGGKFGHGFIAAGAGGTVGGKIDNIGGSGTLGPAIRTVARAILGGTISKLTGGKFANGAGAAAFASIVVEGAKALQKGCSGQMCRSAGKPSMQERRNAINDEWIADNIPNPFNVTDENLANAGFGDPEPASRAKFHNNWFGFKGNRKYVHPKGYEIVLDVNNALVTHPAVMGTYNYGHNNFTHFFRDIVPYYIHGNSAADTTTFGQRFMESFE